MGNPKDWAEAFLKIVQSPVPLLPPQITIGWCVVAALVVVGLVKLLPALAQFINALRRK